MIELDIGFAALDRDGDERFQSLRRQLGVRGFGMNLIVLQPRQRGRIHAHGQQEEVYFVLEGELTLLVEGVEHVLGADRLVRVGPAVRRQLVNAGSQRLVLLALGGSGDHVGQTARRGPRGRTTGRVRRLRRFRCQTTYRQSEPKCSAIDGSRGRGSLTV